MKIYKSGGIQIWLLIMTMLILSYSSDIDCDYDAYLQRFQKKYSNAEK